VLSAAPARRSEQSIEIDGLTIRREPPSDDLGAGPCLFWVAGRHTNNSTTADISGIVETETIDASYH